MKTNKAGKVISGHFLRPVLPSEMNDFRRYCIPFLNINLKRYAYMSVLVLCVDINVQI